MKYNRLNSGLLIRLLLFAVVAALIPWCLQQFSWLYTLTLFLLLIFLTRNLILFVNGVNRKLAFFFDAIKNEDHTLRFPETVEDKSLRHLHKSLNRVNQIIREIRIRNEHNQRFFMEFMKHSATGLMAVDEKGFIEIINGKALEFCGLSYVSHINRIGQSNKTLYDALIGIQAGQSLSVKWPGQQEIRQISLKMVFLKFGEKNYRIYSLYDIKAELEDNELDTWQKLIRILTHEIMNSIAPITSLSNTLSKFYTKNGQPVSVQEITQKEINDTIQALAVIEERGEGLIQFVDSYRKLTKIPAPKFKPVNIKEWTRNIELLSGKRMEDEKIAFSVIHQHKSESFYADEKLLTQVIINLLNNAADAVASVKHKKINIHISDTPEGMLKISITDNGSGFSAAELENLFIPFYTTKENGTGIGLSLSRQIMRLHKGSISARSIPGKETTFELVI